MKKGETMKKEKKDEIKKALDHRGIVAEFRDFALRGNVMDMAVAAVIGLAFGAIVNSLVNNIILQLIGSIISIDVKDLAATINGVKIEYGLFLQAIINFFIITIVMFVAIKFINLFRRKKEDEADGCAPDDAADKK
ncbi:MAG: large conductance mechanosensitive channel protein MscL [Clostridiales Family XIII bacterium]|nr:large conductance mechanosensitive channel protein MscL [Clostridiales Family XIII bacterium]